MRRSATIIVAAVLLISLAGTSALGADKIAYIHSEQIRQEYNGARDIETALQASVADWRAQAQTMESEIQGLVTELQSQRLLLSEDAAQEKERSIQEKQVAFEGYLNEVWGVGGLAARKEAELWQPVFDRVNAIINEIGEEGDYSMIFDAAQMGIVFAVPETDLTQQVLDKLNGEVE